MRARHLAAIAVALSWAACARERPRAPQPSPSLARSADVSIDGGDAPVDDGWLEDAKDAASDARDADAETTKRTRHADAETSERALAPTVAPPATLRACDDYAKATCARIAACARVIVQRRYGDAATCVARESLLCRRRATFPGTGLDDATLASCTSAMPATACTTLLDDSPREPCAPPGKLGAASPCIDDAQCGPRLRCRKAYRHACGVCAKPLRVGARCGGDDKDMCEDGLGCTNALEKSRCMPLPKRDEACGGDGLSSCAGNDHCDGLRCTARPKIGDPCSGGACDGPSGLVCPESRSPTCRPMTILARGARCQRLPGFSECVGGTHCSADDGFAPTYRCVANAADGERCSGCTYPATCRDGVCRLPDATECQ